MVRTNISTSAFYDQMEAANLLVPMKDVIQAFEDCLDGDISGETLEIEPRSGVVKRAPPEHLDQDAADTIAMLHKRGAPLHEPSRSA